MYQFVGENLRFMKDLSARLYVKAEEAKKAGEDWKGYVLKQFVSPDEMQVLLLEYDPAWRDKTPGEKQQEFSRRTRLGRGTYFNRKRDLQLRMAGHAIAGR